MKRPRTACLREDFNAEVAEVHDCLRNIDMIAPKTVGIFREKIAKYPAMIPLHTQHLMETQAYQDTAVAEGLLFDALVKWNLNDRTMSDDIGRRLKETLSAYDKAYATTMKWVDRLYPIVEGQDTSSDRGLRAVCERDPARHRGIEKMLTAARSDKPDMSFLDEEVVER